MTPEDLRAVVDTAIGNHVLVSYPQLIVLVLVSGTCAYVAAYLKRKGENLATKEDLDKLTSAVEQIKTDYAQKLEDYKEELQRRSQAAKVAKVLANVFYGKDGDKREFMELVWELSIWLPPELVCGLRTGREITSAFWTATTAASRAESRLIMGKLFRVWS